MKIEDIKEIESNINMLLDMFDAPSSDEERFKIVDRIEHELSKLKESTIFLTTQEVSNINNIVQ